MNHLGFLFLDHIHENIIHYECSAHQNSLGFTVPGNQNALNCSG